MILALEAVLGAVGFVGDNDDVFPFGEGFVDIAFFRLELLDGGEDDAAGGDFEQGFEVVAAGGLNVVRLAQQLFAMAAKVSKSWSSRSLRSVMTTTVGLLRASTILPV